MVIADERSRTFDLDAVVGRAVRAVAAGGAALVVDDGDPANGANIVMAAQAVDAASAAFMVRHGSGLLCAALDDRRADFLELPPMVDGRAEQSRASYAVSVDARYGIGTGISAEDRATTLRVLADPEVDWTRLRKPGHVFPLRCHSDGVLVTPGRPEAALDLVRLAGRGDVAALCRAVGEDGSLLQGSQIEEFATREGLPTLSLSTLVAYRRRHGITAECVVSANLPTPLGDGQIHLCELRPGGEQHVAFTIGGREAGKPVLCHVHQDCFEGDVLRSHRCSCRAELDRATELIASHGEGVLVYLRGSGEARLDRPHHPLSAADAGQVLRSLGVASVILCGAHDLAFASGLRELGITVAGTLPLPTSHVGKGLSAEPSLERPMSGTKSSTGAA